MGILGKIKNEVFHPTFISIFFNPFYLTRRSLEKHLSNNSKFIYGKVLDFGCGSKPYKNLFNFKEYIGLDIEESGHSHSNDAIDVYYDGNNIPFQDKYFDSIFSTEVFEHIFNIDDILKEINRVLKIGGNIVITVPFVWNEHEIPYDYGRYSSYGIKYLLEKHGFKVEYQYKNTNYIETLFQMWNAYVFDLMPKNYFIRLFLCFICIFPSNLIGIIFSKLLPKNDTFYIDNVVIAKKIVDK